MVFQSNYTQFLDYIYRNQCLPYDTVPCSSENVSDALASEIKNGKFILS